MEAHHNMQHMMSLVQKILVDSVMNLQWHKMNKKDVVGMTTFGLIALLPIQSHYYITRAVDFMRKRSLLTLK